MSVQASPPFLRFCRAARAHSAMRLARVGSVFARVIFSSHSRLIDRDQLSKVERAGPSASARSSGTSTCRFFSRRRPVLRPTAACALQSGALRRCPCLLQTRPNCLSEGRSSACIVSRQLNEPRCLSSPRRSVPQPRHPKECGRCGSSCRLPARPILTNRGCVPATPRVLPLNVPRHEACSLLRSWSGPRFYLLCEQDGQGFFRPICRNEDMIVSGCRDDVRRYSLRGEGGRDCGRQANAVECGSDH